MAQEGQITDRFTRAVDQPASPVPIGPTSAWTESTPWNASRTTPQPTGWL
jgi:hypothetical protein